MSSSHNGPPPSPSLVSLSASKPVNSNVISRSLTLTAIKVLKRLRPREGQVLMLTDKICVKYGRHIHLSEASTMQFISQNTSIPVPKVLCSFNHSKKTYIVMEKIKGDIIGNGWVRRSEYSKTKLLSQLAEQIRKMRDIQPPQGTKISSINGESLFDCRLPGTTMRFGPFDTVQEFHRHLREGTEHDPRLPADVQDLISQHDNTWPLVFTHGDLSSLNVLVRGENIVGIIDWETAGWYPSYWEYTTAYQVNPQNSFWIHEIDKFLQPMPEELAMERTRQKYFGVF
ncbi:hypothetical protein N7456_012413 [Penicillium angulare]|uniref:Aminoglycoside phosphotransferase domain-containing protein n=1 Tax=Penicillium angulare TaxID=116970 RepID=A0A9W9EVG5_9EURO|nr:hypothetical protein N7456_012413 [Penicillium angulare]